MACQNTAGIGTCQNQGDVLTANVQHRYVFGVSVPVII